MIPRDVRQALKQIASDMANQRTEDAFGRMRSVFSDLLKLSYMQFRGQVRPVVLRGLLERETAIGGEDAEFKDFDDRQMVALLVRGCSGDGCDKWIVDSTALAATVDLASLQQWMSEHVQSGCLPRAAELEFLHIWLRLLAETVGALDAASDEGAIALPAPRGPSESKASFPVPGKPYTEPVTGISFVFVPGANFLMGDRFDDGVADEKPVHDVRLSDYFMSVSAVTQAQWLRLMDENPSAFVADDHPVEQVTFKDVSDFIDRLNAKCPAGVRYDLPSEAQWEFAARSGGKKERYAGGDDPETLVWFEDNSPGHSAPVGRRPPNGLGLFDMSGNVWEWCRDIYQPDAYRHHPSADPVCTKDGTDRVIRGGSWNLDAWSARCARRFRFDPELFGPALGFRLVMVVESLIFPAG